MEQTVVNKESSSNKKYKEDFVRLGDLLLQSILHKKFLKDSYKDTVVIKILLQFQKLICI